MSNDRSPDDDEEFHELMMGLDQELAKEGRRIHQRPMAAGGLLAQKFGVIFALSSPLHDRVSRWYKQQYGDRLKSDPSLGRMVVMIKRDLWIVRFPLIFGTVDFDDRRILQCIDDLPLARRDSISVEERERVRQHFAFGYRAFGILKGTQNHKLVASALADASAAVNHLMATPEQSGLSKWSSLQLAEKVFKAAIDLNKGSYSHTHKLSSLKKQAEAAGLQCNWGDLFERIECSPGIRYGDEACNQEEALAAHHASLELVIRLYNAGAKFQSMIEFR